MTLVGGRKLKDQDLFGKMDPYCKVEIFAGAQATGKKWKSKTINKGGKNPQWNQRQDFQIIDGQDRLFIQAYDEDTGSDDFIGSVMIDLNKAYAQGMRDEWFPLMTESRKPAGEIRVVLQFQPSGHQQPYQQQQAPAQAYPPQAAAGGGMGYLPPAPQPGYGAPPQAVNHPPVQGAYGQPPAAQAYGAPPPGAPAYGAPPGGAPAYGAPPPGAQAYGAPPGAPGYGAPPQAAPAPGYGAPPPAGYGQPPPQGGAYPPQAGAYPPQPQGYPAQVGQPPYGAPPPQY